MIIDCPTCHQPYDDGYTQEAKDLFKHRTDRAAVLMTGMWVALLGGLVELVLEINHPEWHWLGPVVLPVCAVLFLVGVFGLGLLFWSVFQYEKGRNAKDQ